MKKDAPFHPDTFYHIYNHAIGDSNLYREAENYYYFLNLYADYIEPLCGTYTYCLMPNHFHFIIKVRSEEVLLDFCHSKYSSDDKYKDKLTLLLEAPDQVNLHQVVMQEFQNFLNGYTKAINKRYHRKGGLFLHHLKRKIINSEPYLSNAIQYVHNNAVLHGFCSDVLDWEFSSIHAILSNKATKLERDAVLCIFDSPQEFLRSQKKRLDMVSLKEIEFW